MLDVLLRGTERVVTEEALASRLASKRPLRVKLGLDPTAPAVTLGWAVVLRKLRQFQEHGHIAVLIIGDFTAQVGDPSGKSETRRRLSADEVGAYAERVLAGFRKILLPEPLEIRHNSEWLANLDMEAILELTSQVTVAQMLERGDFAKRYAARQPITLMEFVYPLLQGMDSVAVRADIELGGSDQLWNLMVGRVLQERAGQDPQIPMTMPLLVGTDGVHKMSQSLGNYIAIDDAPAEMFGKIMSIPDELLVSYFELCTDVSEADVADIAKGLSDGSLHPGETKRRLGSEIVKIYWGADEALAAEAAFDQVFKRHEAPQDTLEFRLPGEDPVYLPSLLRSAGLVASASEARRLIDGGAVKIDGERIGTFEVPHATLRQRVLQVGKRRFVRLIE
ncbi:tyrosine--tRNA ligase [bacterium BMS3Abin02]|nr:tyrosine--tRNA ligase [bacterium BMS3Abin02]GBE21407.1 tyrosine--tRNA ligase [bacterium BMS3Bbin01]HDK45685.1 tyrosine--tRNA ligase [Actinomycetota bacterium]